MKLLLAWLGQMLCLVSLVIVTLIGLIRIWDCAVVMILMLFISILTPVERGKKEK